MDNVETRTLKTMSEVFGLDNLTLDTNLEEEDVDSLDAVEMLMALEDEFMVELHDDEVENLRTPLQFANLIKTKNYS